MRLTLFFIALTFTFFSQNRKELNDFSFTLHEETVNKVLAAIGEINGTSDYEVMFVKGKYHWKIINPVIHIRPDSSQFDCDALVDVGPFSYKTKVVGDVKITYNEKTDKIVIKITRAIFELYTVILDKKFHIKDIHLEDHFKEPFMFDGPKSYDTSMDVPVNDSVTKKLYIVPSDCDFKVKYKEVCATCEIKVSEKPFKPLMAVPTYNSKAVPTGTTPINSAKTNSAVTTKTVQAISTKTTPAAPTKTTEAQKK